MSPPAPSQRKEGEPPPTEPAAAAESGTPVPREKGPKGKSVGKGKPPKAAATPEPKKKGKPIPDNPDFRYIVRFSGFDLDGRRSAALALTGVRGIGLRVAETTCRIAGIDPMEMIGNLPEATVDGLEVVVHDLPTRVPHWIVNHPQDRATGASLHLVGGDLETGLRDDTNLMKMIRSYKGVRHERGQKVRGQRTRSNGRTGMAAGVLKKAAKEAAAAKEATPAPTAPAPTAAPKAGETPAPPK